VGNPLDEFSLDPEQVKGYTPFHELPRFSPLAYIQFIRYTIWDEKYEVDGYPTRDHWTFCE
jgi:hypothetical protein